MRLTSSFPFRLALGLVFSIGCLFTAQSNADELLTIGSKAPELDIEHWVSDRDGEMPHVTKFEEGKIYIVEFWATWCGPCISSMPHLAEMQDEYADDGVQLISVSREDLKTVEKFLKRDVRGKKDMTYADLTGTYCLTTDPDASVSKEYMRAAYQNGIPTAFIVGKTGLIEYIGHPMRMEDPLKQIIAGEWDRDAAKEKLLPEQKSAMVMGQINELMRDGKKEEAYEKINGIIKETKEAGEEVGMQTLFTRFRIGMEIGGDTAADSLNEASELFADNPQMLNQISWGVVEQVQAGEKVDEKILKAACDVAKKGVAATRENGSDDNLAAILDTHANLLFLCGDLDNAIAAQEEALKLTDDPQIKKFLEKLKKAKEEKDA